MIPAQGLLFDGRIAEDFKLTNRHMGERRAAAPTFLDHFAP